jgi:hypothetical protein
MPRSHQTLNRPTGSLTASGSHLLVSQMGSPFDIDFRQRQAAAMRQFRLREQRGDYVPTRW